MKIHGLVAVAEIGAVVEGQFRNVNYSVVEVGDHLDIAASMADFE
jgi:hypothetical protein